MATQTLEKIKSVTASDDFDAWFGDGVVSANGKPTVVYHATEEKFTKFKNPEIGYHFAVTDDLALSAAHKGGKYRAEVMEVVLNLSNVIEIEGQGNGFTMFRFLDDLLARKYIDADMYDRYMDEYDKYEDLCCDQTDAENRKQINNMAQRIAKELGVDGFKYWNEFDSTADVAANWSYIALRPDQIRLAANCDCELDRTSSTQRARSNFKP